MQYLRTINKLSISCLISERSKFIHSYIYKMNKAYMRCPNGSDVFELSFQYYNSNLNVNRQFNFSRKLNEPVSTFLMRISTNVEKIINKKQKKKKENSPADTDLLQIKLFQNGEEVPGDLPCEYLFNTGGDIRLKLNDQEFDVVINTPWIKNIELPSSMLATFPVYPVKFEALFIEKQMTEFTWFKSLDNINWISVGIGFLYVPTKNDINYTLKLCCLPKNSSTTGPHTEVISTEKIQADPGPCPFETRQLFAKDKLTGKNLRVVSYNLLADLYCDSDYSRTVLFPYCPPYALHIDYRKQLILKELIGYNADIICLQEVDEKVFDNDLVPVLSIFDLLGNYNKKGGTLREGLACFYNKSRFNLLEARTIILGENLDANPLIADIWNNIEDNESLVKRLTERTTTLQITILNSLDNDEILVVANTHLYFHPDADHIRLLQAGISSIYIEDIIKKTEETYKNKRVSLIYCGDFNSVPECGIYKLFTTGHVQDDFVDWSSNQSEAVTGVSLTNNRLLKSACGTPTYTNYTVGFKDCLDYIFIEKDKFEVTQIIPLLSDEELSAHIAIPSVIVPSDHVSLIADIKWL